MTDDLMLSSQSFEDGGRIPDRYGYTNRNVNPPLTFLNVPDGTGSLALVMDDPDAKEPAGKVWDHWVLYNIPADTAEIREGSVPDGAVEGQNDFGETGYGGPNPPDLEHTYVFTLYALDTELDLGPGATKDELEDAIEGHVLAEAELTGRFSPGQA